MTIFLYNRAKIHIPFFIITQFIIITSFWANVNHSISRRCKNAVSDIILHKFINDCCKYYGNSYKGKFESSKIYLNKNIKLPIIISENYELIIFPTNSIRNPNCIWIVYNNIDNIKKLDNKNTIIIFKNGIEFCVNCSYNVINNQINNCARLKCVLIERKRALNV